ncbi:unnamed protein product [Rotaria sordida]|uniref:Uncharacterized protein n=1 Tax=Rotaria sordida TaxID=392033 RepID=A0A815QAL7_9BILA|nr:unnamed protein product [Rotaria sordida]CAF1153351.1 unnamed protein product [Rotaria sordida]CAF1163424.1 unnamed protein product [Rotaria sordida]CAF1460778.1 unnamed protein product [Rotaria sordida]CAF3570333.1 unnamed protein product [Rotaria sordida]
MEPTRYLFTYLFTQKYQICRRNIEPLWYLNETTQIMKHVCPILIEKFYSYQSFRLIPSLSSSSEDKCVQYANDMKDHYHHH